MATGSLNGINPKSKFLAFMKSGNQSKSKKRPNLISEFNDDYAHLKLDFGGIFANLEDREWRIAAVSQNQQQPYLIFAPGHFGASPARPGQEI